MHALSSLYCFLSPLFTTESSMVQSPKLHAFPKRPKQLTISFQRRRMTLERFDTASLLNWASLDLGLTYQLLLSIPLKVFVHWNKSISLLFLKRLRYWSSSTQTRPLFIAFDHICRDNSTFFRSLSGYYSSSRGTKYEIPSMHAFAVSVRLWVPGWV